MVRIDYLIKGLYALSRAHQVNAMAGHLGAAVVAGYFVSEQNPELDEAVYRGIEKQLELIMDGHSVFSPKAESKISTRSLFDPLPRQPPMPERIEELANALAANIDEPRQSGHNVIFTSIAIRALKDHPDLATDSAIDGLKKLIALFNNAHAGSGYYGREKGRIPAVDVQLPENPNEPYQDFSSMAVAVIEELIAKAGNRRDGFGGLWHVINHAAAVAELAVYGFRDLAVSGIPAHFKHLQLFATVPDVSDELGAETESRFDPHQKEFWTQTELKSDRSTGSSHQDPLWIRRTDRFDRGRGKTRRSDQETAFFNVAVSPSRIAGLICMARIWGMVQQIQEELSCMSAVAQSVQPCQV
ncbi:MAG: hypothetical protein R3C03_21440 [Pirellulaceae bacterium]